MLGSSLSELFQQMFLSFSRARVAYVLNVCDVEEHFEPKTYRESGRLVCHEHMALLNAVMVTHPRSPGLDLLPQHDSFMHSALPRFHAVQVLCISSFASQAKSRT